MTETARAHSLLHATERPEDAAEFLHKFDGEPFLFAHRLRQDARFDWEQIRALARRLPFKVSYSGALPVTDGFKQPGTKRLTFDETLDRLQSDQGWIILKKVHQDPEYRSVLRDCLSEVEQLVHRSLDPLIESRTMSLIISSPGQVTPYHVDADCNFLFQLHGPKTLHVFNGRDRSVLPEEEEERFWAGDLNAARYREETQAKAWSFALAPGNGVHVPVMFPHWAESGDQIAVGLSVNFRFHGRIRGDVHRVNHALRLLGVRPRAAGESRLADFLKVTILSRPRRGLLLARRILNRLGR